MDFIGIAPDGHAGFVEGFWIASRDLTPNGTYLQDHTGTDTLNRELAPRSHLVDGNDKYLKSSDSAKVNQTSAIFWPFASLQNKQWLPVVTFVGASFFVLPFIDEQMSVFVDVSLGYLIAGMVFYLENRDNVVAK